MQEPLNTQLWPPKNVTLKWLWRGMWQQPWRDPTRSIISWIYGWSLLQVYCKNKMSYYFCLVEIAIVVVIGSVEDECTFNILNFMNLSWRTNWGCIWIAQCRYLHRGFGTRIYFTIKRLFFVEAEKEQLGVNVGLPHISILSMTRFRDVYTKVCDRFF